VGKKGGGRKRIREGMVVDIEERERERGRKRRT
jgi:hypothetical protein